ncbi:MAG: aconitase X [Pseudomonadota bacterium]
MNRSAIDLTPDDLADLEGKRGRAVQWAMDLVMSVAISLRAPRLVTINGAHLVGAYHSGPANLAFLNQLAGFDARVRVPTTLNASSADLTDEAMHCYRGKERESAREVVRLLCGMGCRATLTCAPYFLQAPPAFGGYLAWAESNAVLFANSVLGARTLKCTQYFDLACALVGRAPYAGVMTDEGRTPEIIINTDHLSDSWFDDRIGFQLIGYAAGAAAGAKAALIKGLPECLDNTTLQGICAAAGVSGSLAMLHIEGSTPEALSHQSAMRNRDMITLQDRDLHNIAESLRSDLRSNPVGVCIGTPHAGPELLTEISAKLTQYERSIRIPIYISIGRNTYADKKHIDVVDDLLSKGVTIVRDTCTYYGALFEKTNGLLLTNSVKWAAYASTGLPCAPVLATLDECLDSAVTGHYNPNQNFWNGWNDR